MTVQDPNTIDVIAHDPKSDEVLLIMVEHRLWGDSGQLLPDLQSKLNAYLAYVTEGQLLLDYPSMAAKKVHFQLRTLETPGVRELRFLNLVVEHHLIPENIRFSWRVINDEIDQGLTSLNAQPR